VTHRVGRLWIRRAGLAFDVMFAPTADHEILNVALTLERMSKLAL
jgi:hypothetical protein